MIKRISSIIITLACILCVAITTCASTFNDSITFSVNSVGSASDYHRVDTTGSAVGFYTVLTGVGFVGMSPNVMPYGAEVYFRLYNTSGEKASNYNFHNATHFAMGTWKHDTFLGNNTYPNGTKFKMKSNSNASMGATVGVTWCYY